MASQRQETRGHWREREVCVQFQPKLPARDLKDLRTASQVSARLLGDFLRW